MHFLPLFLSLFFVDVAATVAVDTQADLVDLEARVHHFHHYMDVPERVMKNQKAEKRRCVSYRPLLLPDGGPQRVFVKVSQVVGRS